MTRQLALLITQFNALLGRGNYRIRILLGSGLRVTCAVVTLLACIASEAEAARRPLSATDAIESQRVAQPLSARNWTVHADGRVETPLLSGISVSPNRKRYAAMLVRGDVNRN